MIIRKFKTIFLLSFYSLFNLGIIANFHFCENGETELFIFNSEQAEHSCCHDQNKECDCEHLYVMLSFSDEQLTFKDNQKKPFSLNKLYINSVQTQLITYYKKETSPYNIDDPPPKTGKQKILNNKQLLFYA